MSSSEINELFEGAHRQVVDSGIATNIVLEHRAARVHSTRHADNRGDKAQERQGV